MWKGLLVFWLTARLLAPSTRAHSSRLNPAGTFNSDSCGSLSLRTTAAVHASNSRRDQAPIGPRGLAGSNARSS